MTQVLAIARVMPPTVMPRTVQISRVLRELKGLGWDFTVVCIDDKKLRRKQNTDHTLLPNDDKRPHLIHIRETLGRWLTQKLGRSPYALDAVPKNEQQWVLGAIPKAIELANSQQFDLMVSFAQPWSDHIIGLEVKRKTGIDWLVHFSDPWIDSPYITPENPHYGAWQQAEKDVIEQADGVVFTNQRTVDLVMKKYPSAWRDKVRVIPHAYDRRYKPETSLTQNDKLHLMYSGNFYGIRTPLPLLNALQLLTPEQRAQIKVTFVGNMHFTHGQTVEEMGLSDVIHMQGLEPYGESLNLANTADVLLLIDAPSEQSVFLPSKLVDYMMLEKPILGITPPDGESADLVRNLGYPVHDTDDAQGIADTISMLLAQWTQGNLTVSDDYRTVAQAYDAPNVAKQWDTTLKNLL